MNIISRLATAAITAGLMASSAAAQNAGVEREILQRADVSSAPQEAIQGTAVIASDHEIGRHTHAGLEIGYVLSGMIEFTVDGELPRILSIGDSFIAPRGVAHNARALGGAPAEVVAVWVIDKGTPLASPAP